ncbi:triose-phosphate transporter [Drepanopeziza brunnea f. sp. 'multigermtubi' MB_m1]|uniref:Triose-phosphate transporter n=1 Tax=Marssonina brunnea f. sp. multigermtubi (strain MB_m1) TaxID=1072389 RepID=K1WUW3_MARBU|nr:triose-phosphate transporter [Drepanopeziza brunnea f. sp. 'multigermtubi' MB_m1]EKD16217.1 triose-phosphate transporter [Drepanopeziza brunnea f. sp. 'multigermtubi' MB_m1]
MPNSTLTSMSGGPRFKFPDDSEPTQRTSMEKFPDHFESPDSQSPYLSSPTRSNGYTDGSSSAGRWQSLKDSGRRGSAWNGQASIGGKHGRQPSLSDAFRTIRTRKGSISANVHEVADALKAPVSPKLITLCIIWYMSSALTSTSSKAILNAFPKPATLTLIQFAFVAFLCLFFSHLATVFPSLQTRIPALKHRVRYPTREVIVTTMPLAAFQIGGHLLSSSATMKIPVSLVHTIKGLSPLFTVLAYRVIFDIRYPITTYISLTPLTLGVMLACSAEFRGNFLGIFYAFLAALIFVTQNIFSKRLFNAASKAEASGVQSRKLDKLNLLCYSSGLAFVLTSPIWFWSEGLEIMRDFFHDGTVDLAEGSPSKPAFDHGRLALEYVFNGTFHFGQNIIAFVLLSMVSPVTYSVASLIKRVFIVVIAIIWFRNPTTKIQGLGIALTFFGLYLYDRTSQSSKADKKAKMMDIKEDSLLPSSHLPNRNGSPAFDTPVRGYTNGYAINSSSESKKSDDFGRVGNPRGASNVAWLPPGTRQEETWRPRELSANGNGSFHEQGHGEEVGGAGQDQYGSAIQLQHFQMTTILQLSYDESLLPFSDTAIETNRCRSMSTAAFPLLRKQQEDGSGTHNATFKTAMLMSCHRDRDFGRRTMSLSAIQMAVRPCNERENLQSRSRSFSVPALVDPAVDAAGNGARSCAWSRNDMFSLRHALLHTLALWKEVIPGATPYPINFSDHELELHNSKWSLLKGLEGFCINFRMVTWWDGIEGEV